MDVLRHGFDKLYDLIKPVIFSWTRNDPENAHGLFVSFCKILYKSGLERIILDNESNKCLIPFDFSNAAGFNKNGGIPPSVLYYLGFNRVVVGTVTHDSYEGNPRPRCERYAETGSFVNWMGFPGDGSKSVADQLAGYGNHQIPITVNFMSTPKKYGDELLRDLEETILDLRDTHNVDRFELNISCPNTPSQNNFDARIENQKQLDDMLSVAGNVLHPAQELYVKVSPDLDAEGVDEIISVAQGHLVEGFTISNISTKHDPKHVLSSSCKGGVSGNAVYDDSLRVQSLFYKNMLKKGNDWKIIACGGINSLERLKERLLVGAQGIQIYTPLIFSGPKILREFKNLKYP